MPTRWTKPFYVLIETYASAGAANLSTRKAKEVTREDAKNDSRVQWMMENDVEREGIRWDQVLLTKYVAQWRRGRLA